MGLRVSLLSEPQCRIVVRVMVAYVIPEYATLESLVEDWQTEQRALCDGLAAARASTKDMAHP